MDHAYRLNISATPPTPPSSFLIGYPQAGSQDGTTPPTFAGTWWYYMMTEELRNLIIAAGLTPSPTNLNQVTLAVEALAAVAAQLAVGSGVYTNIANVFTNQQAITPYRANITGAVSIDLKNTAKSNNLFLTLTGNVTSFALTNPADGATYNIKLIQGGSGGYTFSGFPSTFKFTGGVAPTFSTGATGTHDFCSALYDLTLGQYDASFLPGMA